MSIQTEMSAEMALLTKATDAVPRAQSSDQRNIGGDDEEQ